MADTTALTTYRLFNEAGAYRIPTDSGLGTLYRPFARPLAQGRDDGRTATLETLWDYFINNAPDPDEAKKLDPLIDRKIRMHPDVRAAMAKREKTVAAYPDRIDPNPLAPDQQLARELAKEIEWSFRQIKNIEQLYVHLQSAVMWGGAGVEFVWHREASGVERPAEWWPIHKSRFVRDRLGNIALRTRTDPVWGAYVSPNPNELVQRLMDPDRQIINSIEQVPGKWIYHVYRQEPGTWDNPELEGYVYWGIGEDVPLYYPVTFDIFVIRARMKWLEKYGDPTIDIYYPEAMAGFEPILKRIADSSRGESVVTIPGKIPGNSAEQGMYWVQQRDVPAMSYDAFERFSDGWTKKRIDAILLGSSDENQKGDTGSYGDHESRKDSGPQVFFTLDAKLISNTLNTQLLPAMFHARFPDAPLVYCPVHKLEPKEERDRAQEAEIITTACELVDISKDEVYEKLGFRKPSEGDEVVEAAPEEPGMGLPGMPPKPGEKPQGVPDKPSALNDKPKPPMGTPKQRTMPRMNP